MRCQLGKSIFLLFFLPVWSLHFICLYFLLILWLQAMLCFFFFFFLFCSHLAVLTNAVGSRRRDDPVYPPRSGKATVVCFGVFALCLRGLVEHTRLSLLICHRLKITWTHLTSAHCHQLAINDALVVCQALMSSWSEGGSTIASACQPEACYLSGSGARHGGPLYVGHGRRKAGR